MAYNPSNGLIRVKDQGTSTYVTIPLKYISYENYKVTPQQMIDLDSYVSETGKLIRNVLSHTRTKIEFTTPYINSKDWAALWAIISAGFSDALERKCRIIYYDPFEDTYKNITCYVPDIEFTVRNVDETAKVVNYDGIRIAFIEY